nr:hypothetical protein [Tanacetum cinerariifolium]
ATAGAHHPAGNPNAPQKQREAASHWRLGDAAQKLPARVGRVDGAHQGWYPHDAGASPELQRPLGPDPGYAAPSS